ncbi:hypothetical protein D9M68_682640 [compost metagenome]
MTRRARGEIFKARVSKGAVDLVEEPMRQKNDRRERHEERDDGVVALRQRRIDKPDRVVAPDCRRDATVVKQVIFIESLRVQQAMGEIEPGVEEHHAKYEERNGRPPAEGPGREQGPALILGKETDRHGRAGDEDRGHALADLDGLALLAAPPLLDAAFGIAVVEPGDAVAQDKIDQHGCRVDYGQQGNKGEAVLEKGAQIGIRRGEIS